MTRSAYHILEALAEVDTLEVQSPSVIAYNLDYRQATVSRKLKELSAHDPVEKIEDGRYRITDTGRDFIQGNLSPGTLE